ncbi:MAG: glycosyl hydrolase family 39, partial [Rhodospirillales bacterium]|nr:glycosyl hydrolase family 39 [Acetobacter sp.]
VEISFMPKKLAFNPDALHPFWYKQNVSPPKSWEKWDGLMSALAKNLVEHFGIEEVATWYFEVWNEPNIDFWGGIPRDKSYYELYEHTAKDLKAVSSRLRVGGPSTAAAQWVPSFLKYVKAHNVPIDFVSSHGYADEEIDNIYPDDPSVPRNTPMDDRVCLAVHKVRKEIDDAGMKQLPLFWTEWNVQYDSQARDTTFVGPGVAHTILGCDGAVQQMSFWTFSDVFEEGGPGDRPFSGQFGLRAEFGINKPSFYDFALLHKLGTERMVNASKDAIVTRTADGGLAIAVWNIVDPPPTGEKRSPVADNAGVPRKQITLSIQGVPSRARVTVERVDDEHGNVLPVYAAMGKPQYPTLMQVEEMNRKTALPIPEATALLNGKLDLSLEPNALVLVKVSGR